MATFLSAYDTTRPIQGDALYQCVYQKHKEYLIARQIFLKFKESKGNSSASSFLPGCPPLECVPNNPQVAPVQKTQAEQKSVNLMSTQAQKKTINNKRKKSKAKRKEEEPKKKKHKNSKTKKKIKGKEKQKHYLFQCSECGTKIFTRRRRSEQVYEETCTKCHRSYCKDCAYQRLTLCGCTQKHGKEKFCLPTLFPNGNDIQDIKDSDYDIDEEEPCSFYCDGCGIYANCNFCSLHFKVDEERCFKCINRNFVSVM